MVKLISQKAAGGSIILTRCCQCAPSNTCFLGPTQVHIPNGISNGSAVFVQFVAESPYTLQWAASFFPSKLLIHMGGLDSQVIHGYVGPDEFTTQLQLNWFSQFCRANYSDRQTDRLTDRPRYSVCNNRPHLRT